MVDQCGEPVGQDVRGDSLGAAESDGWSEDARGGWPAISAFLRVDDDAYCTYVTFGRGIEFTWAGSPYLDLTALGRQEAWEEPRGRAIPLGLHASGPAVRLPDEYDEPAEGPATCCHAR